MAADGSSARLRGRGLAAALLGLHLFSVLVALEVSVGKTTLVTALNRTRVQLPCTFTTCIGFEKLTFAWYYNTTEKLYQGFIKNKASQPKEEFRDPRVELIGTTTGKENNISISMEVDFSDAGKYTCFVKNPRENKAEANATLTLKVVSVMVPVDNTLTLIILAVVGGVVGFLILIMLIKKIVLLIRRKSQEKKECLVSSSGIDNTDNGLAGSKAEQKAPPKA
ncbi:sodium channel regulatory subunit beta-4 [Carettochelys insculpta]|uniref:sodium channel regulatory subunit beta-4 n=1 Tax=Carettochelys insculpta TaxID=44489 RepID=UPI003EBDA44B